MQRVVRAFEWKCSCLDAHGNSRHEAEKLFAIAPGEIRDGTDRSLMPQLAVRKRRNVAHVNSAADDNAAAIENAKRGRHKRTDWRKNNRRLQSFRWRFIRSSGPFRAELPCEFLRGGVARGGKS